MTMDRDSMDPRLDRSHCLELFERMFPKGLDDLEVTRELARWGGAPRSSGGWGDLVGCCLWDVFSDGHEVYTIEGSTVDLGSFRAAADFIAEFRSYHGRSATDSHHQAWSYLDFYMGATWLWPEDDPRPVYELIFARMRNVELDWRYVHPRLYLIEFTGMRDYPDDFTHYDPSGAIQREIEKARQKAGLAELRAFIDQAYCRSVERARRGLPPPVVESYRRVYGRLPAGWPPRADSEAI